MAERMSPADTVELARSLAALERKIAAGFDINTRDRAKGTVLFTALLRGDAAAKKVAAFLVNRPELDVKAVTSGTSLLGAALVGGLPEIAAKLLARGARLTKTENPLLDIVTRGVGDKLGAVQLILDRGLATDSQRALASKRAAKGGDRRLIALLGGAPAPRDAKKPASARPAPKKRAPAKLKLDKKKLGTSKSREAALDALGKWFVDALLAAGSDKKLASDVIAHAIASFYDVRESAGQERGEYAGHFFMVDAVGLGDTDRPVPWELLGKRASEKDLALWQALFDKVEPKVR